ncbi:MAG: hypothetical protein AB8F95_02840 [Bacteroidia bacterium]
MTIFILSLLPLIGFSQNGLSLGLRAGLTPGFTARWQATETLHGEALWSFRQGGTQLTGLVSREIPLNGSDLHIYYGGGGHLGYYRDRPTTNDEGVPFRKNHLAFGIDLVAGVAYDIPATPLTIAIDYKPYVDLFYWKNLTRNLGDVGIALRWRFGQKQSGAMIGDFGRK